AEAEAGPGLAERFEAVLADALEAELASDVLIAQSEAQRAAFWTVRESIPEANRRIGAVSSHDIAVPPARIAEFVARARPAGAAVEPGLRVNCFGHLGDGNLHFNVFPAPGRDRRDYADRRAEASGAVYDLVHALGGSISAEHGIGRLKAVELA